MLYSPFQKTVQRVENFFALFSAVSQVRILYASYSSVSSLRRSSCVSSTPRSRSFDRK